MSRGKPTNHPTLRWVFQCFEGVELLHIDAPPAARQILVFRLQPLHEQILTLLGPPTTSTTRPPEQVHAERSALPHGRGITSWSYRGRNRPTRSSGQEERLRRTSHQ